MGGLKPQDSVVREDRRVRPPKMLGKLLEEVAAERQLAGDSLVTLSSSAAELQREKARLKQALRGYVQKVRGELNKDVGAMDLEEARPIYVLYHSIAAQLRKLEDTGAGAEKLGEEQELQRRKDELSAEAQELQVSRNLTQELLLIRQQAKLKKYEEAFLGAHGRKMRSKAEIAPVATEYERFKKVKQLLLELNQ